MLPAITVDIGTTSVKLCVFDAEGAVLASASRPTPTERDSWGEVYALDALVGLVLDFIRDLSLEHRSAVQRIAITGVGESGGLVRPDLSLASPMILWHDHRGSSYLDRLGPADRTRIYQLTGLPVNANYALSKTVWAVHQADGIDGVHWLNIAEYLAALMTGARWSEYSLASRTMALDLNHATWSTEVCAMVGLDAGVFPELQAASQGHPITASFAAGAGLSPEVQVHVAGHDHMVGAVGADLRPGELLNSTGTTEGLLYLRDAPALDGQAEQSKLANGIGCDGSNFTLFASIPTGGSAFATLKSLLGTDDQALSARISALHEAYLAGALDLGRIPLVLPRFRGSPPPVKRAADRGAILGLAHDTTMDEIIFGCFLGLVLQFRDVLDLFRMPSTLVKVIGPASRNPLWLQLKADLLGVSLSVAQFPEVVSRGAQALASGVRPAWESCRPIDVHPDRARTEQLSEWYAGTRLQWEHLKSVPAGVST